MADERLSSEFRALQQKFQRLWPTPTLTMRAQPHDRTVVIVHSINIERAAAPHGAGHSGV
jgi:hypothetical protein